VTEEAKKIYCKRLLEGYLKIHSQTMWVLGGWIRDNGEQCD